MYLPLHNWQAIGESHMAGLRYSDEKTAGDHPVHDRLGAPLKAVSHRQDSSGKGAVGNRGTNALLPVRFGGIACIMSFACSIETGKSSSGQGRKLSLNLGA